MHLVTYNVGNFAPSGGSNLSALLPDITPDIVFVGFQELDAAPLTMMVESVLGENPWTDKATSTFGALGYIKIRSIKLLGMVLSMFCLEKHVPYLRGIETQYTRLGFNGYWGNKGTVSIRFEVYGVSVCVLNSHLAAHDHQNQARIESYDTVLGGHTYSRPSTELILYHDYVFWMGDLNFRLEEDTFTFQQIDMHVAKNQLDVLLAEDQLVRARSAGTAFSELQENLPTFPPTFKYKVGTDVFDAKRRPAWTDRILFKANRANYDQIELSLNQLSYRSVRAFLDSDHKPVTSNFSMAVFPARLADELLLPCFHPIVHFHTEEIYCSEDTNIVYTVDIKDWRHLKSWDWVGVYRAASYSLQEYVGFVWAPSKPVREGGTFEVSFDESLFLSTGNYRLVYYSAESRDILGFSKVLPVRLRHVEPEVGVEATEEL